MTADPHILKFDALRVLDRGNGVQTMPLATREIGAQRITTGLTRFPPGAAIPLHSHNVEEQVTLLEGEAEVEIEAQRVRLKPYDTTYVPAGKHHRFINVGTAPMLILWIYGSTEVTRTFAETGETVPHLSSRDLAALPPRHA